MSQAHLLSWEAKKCLRCGLSVEEMKLDPACSFGSGKNTSPPPFRYSIPLVAPIRVQIPCTHEDVSWDGRCYTCQEVVDK